MVRKAAMGRASTRGIATWLAAAALAASVFFGAGTARADTATARSTADFIDDARLLFRAVACGDVEVELPASISPGLIDIHCRSLTPAIEAYRKEWVAKVEAFMRGVVPRDAPSRVVYPFGGGDLVGALATFPRATEFTTLSLEPGGDPRTIHEINAAMFLESLRLNRQNLKHYYQVTHSRTDAMTKATHSQLPGELIMALAALKLHGYEPVALRYFEIRRDGSLDYLSWPELDAIERTITARRLNSWDRRRELWDVFGNMELVFKKAGAPEGAPTKVYRHLMADCQSSELAKTPGVMAHLESKGPVLAMTKAASYLLWWKKFSRVRRYLLDHMVWMVSDSTGIPPQFAESSGFELVTYGDFHRPFIESGLETTAYFRELWQANPHREVDFYYGYPDSDGHPHLMIARPLEGIWRPPPDRAASAGGE